jgi:hypothetical protein
MEIRSFLSNEEKNQFTTETLWHSVVMMAKWESITITVTGLRQNANFQSSSALKINSKIG